MTTTTVCAVDSVSAREIFVRLPAQLNRRGTYEPAANTERALLVGAHPLSNTLTLQTWLAYRGQQPVGRIGLTTYPGDNRGYVGFLEAQDGRVAAELFATVAQQATDQGLSGLIGPVNASFWWRYRLKVSGFDRQPYFGEPLNPPMHVHWWENAGYVETDRYRSAFYPRTSRDLVLPQFAARHQRFKRDGYEIRPPRPQEWDTVLGDLHALLTQLYSDFPTYKPLSETAFRQLYAPMRLIADYSVMRMAYRDGQPQGFLIAFPDYGLGLSTGTLRQLSALLRHRPRSSQYVLLYLGAKQPGLGSALMHEFVTQMGQRRARVVGALSQVGKPTGGYAGEHIEGRNEYTLLWRGL